MSDFNCYTLESYENYKKEKEQRWETQVATKRRAAIEKKQRIATAKENQADSWFTYKPGDVRSTNVGIIKVAKVDKTSVITTYGKKYTITQLFGSDVAKIIKQKERMKTSGVNW